MHSFKKAGRIVIVVLNIIFFIVSFLVVITGIFLKFLSRNLLVESLETELKAALKSAGAKTGFLTDAEVDALDLTKVFSTTAICFIAIGAFFLLLSFIGFCGACYKIRCLILSYAIVTGVLLLAQILFLVILYASDAFKDLVKTGLKSSLTNFKGMDAVNVESLLWNAAMVEFKCCGVNSYTDFDTNAPNWVKNISYGSPTKSYITLVTPLACCVQTALNISDASCATSPTLTTSNKNTGCFQAIWDTAFDNPIFFGIVLSSTFLIQFLLVVVAFLLYREYKSIQVYIRKRGKDW